MNLIEISGVIFVISFAFGTLGLGHPPALAAGGAFVSSVVWGYIIWLIRRSAGPPPPSPPTKGGTA